MASLVEKIQKMWNPPEDEYDEYYEDEQYEEKDEKVESQPVSSYKETSTASSAPSLFKRSPKVVNMNSKAQLQVVVFKPMSFSELQSVCSMNGYEVEEEAQYYRVRNIFSLKSLICMGASHNGNAPAYFSIKSAKVLS